MRTLAVIVFIFFILYMTEIDKVIINKVNYITDGIDKVQKLDGIIEKNRKLLKKIKVLEKKIEYISREIEKNKKKDDVHEEI